MKEHYNSTFGCQCLHCTLIREEAARATGDAEGPDLARRKPPADAAIADEYWPEGRPAFYSGPRERSVAEQLDIERAFISDVIREVKQARAKFPDQRSEISGLALGEESGEAQRALLHIYEGKGGEAELYLECVQTAAMALRLASESTDRATWKGNAKRGCGGSYEIGSGGHVPGTPGEGCAACDRDYG